MPTPQMDGCGFKAPMAPVGPLANLSSIRRSECNGDDWRRSVGHSRRAAAMALPALHALASVADRETSKAFAKRGRGWKTLSDLFQSFNQPVGPLGIIRSIAFLSFLPAVSHLEHPPPAKVEACRGSRAAASFVTQGSFSSTCRAWRCSPDKARIGRLGCSRTPVAGLPFIHHYVAASAEASPIGRASGFGP